MDTKLNIKQRNAVFSVPEDGTVQDISVQFLQEPGGTRRVVVKTFSGEVQSLDIPAGSPLLWAEVLSFTANAIGEDAPRRLSPLVRGWYDARAEFAHAIYKNPQLLLDTPAITKSASTLRAAVMQKTEITEEQRLELRQHAANVVCELMAIDAALVLDFAPAIEQSWKPKT